MVKQSVITLSRRNCAVPFFSIYSAAMMTIDVTPAEYGLYSMILKSTVGTRSLLSGTSAAVSSRPESIAASAGSQSTDALTQPRAAKTIFLHVSRRKLSSPLPFPPRCRNTRYTPAAANAPTL